MIVCMLGVSVVVTRVRRLLQTQPEPVPVVTLPVRSEPQRRRA
jgi:hypothetical protein